MPVAMIHAWTSMPWACALVIRLSSGSKGAGAMAASVRGRLDREQKQSPRRTTCAKIAFMFAAFTSATSRSIWTSS